MSFAPVSNVLETVCTQISARSHDLRLNAFDHDAITVVRYQGPQANGMP